MSIFKTTGVILKVSKSKEQEFFLDVFSYDYGKIKLKTKKTKDYKTLDIGYTINFEVNVKKENQIHEIRNVKIKNEFRYQSQKYEIIFQYLKILQCIFQSAPEYVPIYEIFDILQAIHEYENISEEKLLFVHIKILYIFGIFHGDSDRPEIQKILSFIQKESIENILRLKGLQEVHKQELEKFIL